MKLFNRKIINNKPKNPEYDGLQVLNSNQYDKGVGYVAAPVTKNTRHELKDLEDLTLVNKTINNARLAVEIDPTTFSSIMSIVITTNKPYEIVGDEYAEDAAVTHIKKKVRDWDLDNNMVTTTWKGLIDGRCFLEKYIPPDIPSIKELLHLAYDDLYYNFMPINDPYTGILLGYKQRARVYPLPPNWEVMGFLTLKNRPFKWEEKNFQPSQVMMPRFINADGNSEGLVFKVLDDVYCLKKLKNMLPDAAKMAANTVFVQVGNKEFPFRPYDINDPLEVQQSKSKAELDQIGENFAEKFKKQVILGDAGVTPSMLGNGQLPEIERYIDVFKQEIRSSLLTPDSRFESRSSNRAVAQEQMSGDVGQIKILDYIRNHFIRHNYERYVFDHELQLNEYTKDIGHVFIQYEEDNKEDEVDLSTIAQGVLTIMPDIDKNLLINTYYPRLAPKLTLEGEDTNTEGDDGDEGTGLPGEVNNGRGIPDPDKPYLLVNDVKKRLVREGVLY